MREREMGKACQPTSRGGIDVEKEKQSREPGRRLGWIGRLWLSEYSGLIFATRTVFDTEPQVAPHKIAYGLMDIVWYSLNHIAEYIR